MIWQNYQFFDFSVDHQRAKQIDFGGNDSSEHLARGDFYHPNTSHEDLGTFWNESLEALKSFRNKIVFSKMQKYALAGR